MHLGFARSWLLFSLVGSVGCSLPETTAASGKGTAPSAHVDHDLPREQNEIEHRRVQQQDQLLSDLHRLHAERAGLTELAHANASHGPQSKLLIFGGANHEVYLGCLCDGKNPESVFNLAGEYGSTRSSTSLRNKRAPYGSSHEDTSACNGNARHPPSVVASDGKALGLLTVNPSLKKRIATQSVTDWLTRVCRL